MGLKRDNEDLYYQTGRLIAIAEKYAGDRWGYNTLNNMFRQPARNIDVWRKYIDTDDEYYKELSEVEPPKTTPSPIIESRMWIGYFHQRSEYSNQATRIRIGQRIAELRKEVGMTQDQLAEKTGIQRAHITRIEAGKYSVGIDLLQKIADVFGKNVDFVEQP